MLLEKLTGSIDLESRTMECKKFLNREDLVGWLKTVAGFANAEGGVLYIGVEDKTNKLLGFTREKADSERNFFNTTVNQYIYPRPDIKIDFLRYTVNEKELFVIKATIKKSEKKPIIVKFKGMPLIFMRREGFTNAASYDEIVFMSRQSSISQYDSLFSDIKYEKNNFKKLFEFNLDYNKKNTLSNKFLLSVGFFDKNNFLANGAVLFSDTYTGQKTEVVLSIFSAINRGSQRIVTKTTFNGCITDSIKYIFEFVRLRMNHSIIKFPTSHKSIDAYPERALFEGIINAIAHRDYFLDGTQIQIDMFKNRLEISSPGSFYQSNLTGKILDLSNIISKRRNELICNILVKCNVMEAAGTGFNKIIEDYKEADSLHKPYIILNSDHFTLVLPDLTYEEGISATNIPEVTFVPVPHGSKHDKKILSFCFVFAKKSADIAKYLGISDSSWFRKKILNTLVENKYLIKDTDSGVSYYKTNRDYVMEV